MTIYEIIGWVSGGTFLLLLLLGRHKKPKDNFIYEPVYFGLFTNTEKKFYRILKAAVGDEFLIFGKVRIADIVRPKKGLSKEDWGKMFWRTSSKHIDFYLADPRTIQPLVLIELNDNTHNQKDRGKRDVMVGKIMEAAGIPLLWVPVKSKYDTQKLMKSIHEAAEAGRKTIAKRRKR